jgi:GcrA cell cycle regulator
MTWTAKRCATLAALWRLGLSTSEIGKCLAVTKNAVIGKAHRMGLPERPTSNPLSAEDAAEIRSRLAAGETYSAIAADRGVTKGAVTRWGHRHGVYSRHGRKYRRAA